MNLMVSLLLVFLSLMNLLFVGYFRLLAVITAIVLIIFILMMRFGKRAQNSYIYLLLMSAILFDFSYLVFDWLPLLWLQLAVQLIASLYFILKTKRNHIGLTLLFKGLFVVLFSLGVTAFAVDVVSNPTLKYQMKLPKIPTVKLNKNNLETSQSQMTNMAIMNSFGSRLTGSAGQSKFIEWLESQLKDAGLTVHENKYQFLNWTAKSSSLVVNHQSIPISSVYPYSGVTSKQGLDKELVYIKNNHFEKASGKIAVVKINIQPVLPKQLIMNQQSAFPQGTSTSASDGDITLAAALKASNLKKAKAANVKGVIYIWEGASDQKVSGQYQPFTTEFAGVPAVWLNENEGKNLIRAAKKHQHGKLTVLATRKKVSTKSFYVTIPGKNSKESIIINSHTDGVNAIEENGAIGMLSMIKYLRHQKPNKTLVFAFVTGHFRLPVFKGTSQATSTWMSDNPQVWDGKGNHMKAVAAVTAEHLGSMEWKDNKKGQFEPTGKIQTEYTYTGNDVMNDVWLKAIKGRSMTRTITLRGHNGFEFGESQPLFNAKIPVIGLIPMPDYLTTSSQNLEMDKFNVNLMHQQVSSLIKATMMLDQIPSKSIGKGENYSYFVGK